ncbi:hypothetical protein C8R44DRAFT_877102 [Mycena epipterygia]|nr:hypothetical protein C8R44DRAFT_877102 [Mycena epipterygia]
MVHMQPSSSRKRMHAAPAAVFICVLQVCSTVPVSGYIPRADSSSTLKIMATAPATSGGPLFTLATIPAMTTCEPATISWIYSPSDIGFVTFSITNADVSQSLPPATSTTKTAGTGQISRRDISYQFSNEIDPEAMTFTWASANVSAGWYAVVAILTDFDGMVYHNESTPFYVWSGTNTSCLHVTLPTPTSSPGSSLNRGAIVGGVLGAIAVLIAGISLYLRLKRRQQKYRDVRPSPNMAFASNDEIRPLPREHAPEAPLSGMPAVPAAPTTKPALPSPAVVEYNYEEGPACRMFVVCF